MAGNCAEMGQSVTSKIASILLTFTQGDEHSMTEIARLAGLPISTTHRLMGELTGRGLLERAADGRYRVGLPLRMIGHADGCAPSIAARGRCVLEDLADVTGWRARLGVLRDLRVAYIEKMPGRPPASEFSPAATLPAHPTALGRVLLAFSAPGMAEMTILRGLPAYTPHTVTAPNRFRRTLAVTRLTRLAISRGEFERGVCGVAVPVFGPGGRVAAGLELSVDDLGRDLRRAMTALSIASRSLSREFVDGTGSGSRNETASA